MASFLPQRRTASLRLRESERRSHCDAAFSCVSHLKSHLSSVHLGLKPYECEWCVVAYASSTSLKAHMESVHSDVA